MFGILSWDAIPLNEPIPLATVSILIVGMLGLLTLVTWKGWWPYLWREWLRSNDRRNGPCYFSTLSGIGSLE